MTIEIRDATFSFKQRRNLRQGLSTASLTRLMHAGAALGMIDGIISGRLSGRSNLYWRFLQQRCTGSPWPQGDLDIGRFLLLVDHYQQVMGSFEGGDDIALRRAGPAATARPPSPAKSMLARQPDVGPGFWPHGSNLTGTETSKPARLNWSAFRITVPLILTFLNRTGPTFFPVSRLGRIA